ncbi:MAG: helix-turn-helix domain-containing protein [archaeon]
MKQITIKNLDYPESGSVNAALQWLCRSLGIFSQRDKDNSCFRIFIELLKETKKGNALSSDELAARLNLVRGTVVYHLSKLMESGVVVVQSRRYSLRSSNLKELVSKVKDDTCDMLEHIEKIAVKLDKSL